MTDKSDEPVRDKDDRISVLLEMRVERGESPSLGQSTARNLGGGVLELDPEFKPVPMSSGRGDEEGLAGLPDTYIMRGTVASEEELQELSNDPRVRYVWRDTRIEPFARKPKAGGKSDGKSPEEDPVNVEFNENPGMSTCPFGTCDCTPGTPKATMAQVAVYHGVDQIWEQGIRGQGIRVGVLDSGMTAQGRPVIAGQTSRRIQRVVGGWPEASWGTRSEWGQHGNMCGTDVLGMAPEAELYDLRISGSGGSPSTISRALQAFQWAIDRYKSDGTPQVLTNSWGIFQESWDTTYARNPNHPFTRKVAEAVDLGIIVLFAAGNCGDTCPDGRCGSDTGTGKSIWGANGHPKVMTVGAVNVNEQLVGYSSRGPASLAPDKPDFCAVTHFTGYFNSDSGTSAACPIAAGITALLKQAQPSRSPAQIKSALIATCKDIGPAGFDIHSGHGIIRGWEAYKRITLIQTRPAVDVAVTRPAIDQIGTPLARDLVGTPVRLDQPGTPPVRDQVATPVIRDQVNTPVRLDQLQTTPRTDLPGTPVSADIAGTHVSDRFQPPQPFVLSTDHQAPDWRSFDDMVGGEEAAYIADLVARIDAMQEALDTLVAEYESAVARSQGGAY